MSRTTWVFTGGHHNSALVVAKRLAQSGDEVYWFGHRHAALADQSDSAEYQEVKDAGITFIDLPAGKLSRSASLVQVLRIPYGISRALAHLFFLKPEAVVSFGGYLGFATGISALILGIPLFLHEQTVVAGKANKFLARFATKTYLTWESSQKLLPKSTKTQVIGLPLRPTLLNPPPQALFPNGRPTILIIGGKQGCHAINKIIFNNLVRLLSRYNLLHQTGGSTITKDYDQAVSAKAKLDSSDQANYHPFVYAKEVDLAQMLSACDLVIGRSGAHITYELGILHQKAILVPLLSTHGQEQLHNAHFLAKHGLALILPESGLTFSKLVFAIKDMLAHKPVTKLKLPRDAASVMEADMRQVLKRI